MYKIGQEVTVYWQGKPEAGKITGKHGESEFYAVHLENGYDCYRYAEDLEPISTYINRVLRSY